MVTGLSVLDSLVKMALAESRLCGLCLKSRKKDLYQEKKAKDESVNCTDSQVLRGTSGGAIAFELETFSRRSRG